jgi:hypothetical protein
MFGNQYERIKKRARDLEKQIEQNKQDEKNLTNRLQHELECFLEQNTDAKHVEADTDGSLTIYLPHRVRLKRSATSGSVCLYTGGYYAGLYYVTSQDFSSSASPDVKVCVRHIFGTLLAAWEEAVATRDYESFECSRTLRWIAKEIPGSTQWPDIISGNFPLK